MEHRPSIFSLHRWRFLARSSPNDVFPYSAKTVRLQVALGHPRNLLPCGFHSNALWQISFWLFRIVCPIQPYFLLLISTFMSDCPVLSHSSSEDIPKTSIDKSLKLLCSVICHKPSFAGPIWHSLILKCKLMLLALQTFFSLENAPLALFILRWTSKSVPPFSSILDPRYKKSSTRSIASFPILLFTRRSLVFSMLTLGKSGFSGIKFINVKKIWKFGFEHIYNSSFKKKYKIWIQFFSKRSIWGDYLQFFKFSVSN